MVCEKSGELMMRYMDGLLDDFDEMNLMKHVEVCDTCREDFAIYKELLEGFNLKNMEITEAPDGFAAAVMEQIGQINIYFPEKVRKKGVIIDNIIFAVWGLAAATFAAGFLMFLFSEQIFAWLDYQGLTGLSAALYPIAAFTTSFGTAVAEAAMSAVAFLIAAVREYWLALTVAVAGLAGLAVVVLYLAPRSVKIREKSRNHG